MGSGSRRGAVGRGPGQASRRRAERSSRRGRLTGGSPPTGTHSDQTPLVWRAPEGPGARAGFEPTRRAKLAARTDRGRVATHRHTQRPGTTGVEGAGGTGGHGRASRSTTPSRRLACGDLAGGRARRRPEHPWGHKQHKQEGRRPRAHQAARPSRTRKAPGPTTHHAAPTTPPAPQATQHRGAGPQARAPSATTQTRTLRSTCVPCRSARAARRSRRSSHSPHLRRRAGPRR